MPGLSEPVRAEPPDSLITSLRIAALVAVVCSVLGVVANAFRPGGIAFFQRTQYEILVPCPETEGEVKTIAADDPVLGAKRTLILDARSPAEYGRWHLPAAMDVPFDYLVQVDPKTLRVIAASGAARVVVYGDGRDPDSGEHLAKEISGRGIRNVGFVPGGAPSLRKSPAGGGPP
jgi:hypothetical protein